MCGIFGLIISENSRLQNSSIQEIVTKLLLLSESRGKEAAGVAIRTGTRIDTYKCSIPASQLAKTEKFQAILDDSLNDDLNEPRISRTWALVGHCRLVTNGGKAENRNNQPVIGDTVVCVHNGIVVNVEDLEKANPELKRKTELDSEIIARLLETNIDAGISLKGAMKDTFKKIRGEASVGALFTDYNDLVLATNTGSVYCIGNGDLFIFASERFILSELCAYRKCKKLLSREQIFQLKPRQGCIVDLQTASSTLFTLHQGAENQTDLRMSPASDPSKVKIVDHSDYHATRADCRSRFDIGNRDRIRQMIAEHPRPDEHLKRCTKCILPESFPFIEFDEQGVCNYCRSYTSVVLKGEGALSELVAPYRSNNGGQDCIVGFSGGRDSSYVLHYTRKKLGMNPIAYTYDWGMVTDLARRNCARIAAGVEAEHIIVSADLEEKWRNVRKNLQAWLRRPDLGMVPLLMAGDKQFYFHARKLRQDTGIQIVLGGANPYEKTDFKLGFCGIPPDDTRGKGLLTGIKVRNKAKLLLYYMTQYLRNPAYLNVSIFDTLHAFYSTYVLKDVYINVYDYIHWDEDEIVSLLRNTYDWEIATDTTTTWRIGDGTAAFYNYIYHTIAGFSEIDTFRSNQIREGVLTREEALRLAAEENQPRVESLEWYAETIQFNLEETLKKIHAIPKRWRTVPIQ
jgi:glucosamine--fructose-6-phosphate aminotransferase (isomerizing)